MTTERYKSNRQTQQHNKQTATIMRQVSLLFIIASYLAILASAARDLKVESKSDRQAVVRGVGSNHNVWYDLAIDQEGIPSLTIKGLQGKGNLKSGKNDQEAYAKYYLSNVRETIEQGASIPMANMKDGELSVQVAKDDSKEVILIATMVHPNEMDIAGNHYAVIMTVTIDGKADDAVEAARIRTTIANFPYRYSIKSKNEASRLVVEGIYASSQANNVEEKKIFGELDVIKDSARDDGNPGSLALIASSNLEQRPDFIAKDAAVVDQIKIQFASNRPKNGTFEETIKLNLAMVPEGETVPEDNDSKDEKDTGKMSGASTSDATRTMSHIGFYLATILVAAVLLL